MNDVILSIGVIATTRHPAAVPFHCGRCNQDKKSKTVATLTETDGTVTTLCNGCRGNLMARD